MYHMIVSSLERQVLYSFTPGESFKCEGIINVTQHRASSDNLSFSNQGQSFL